MKPGKKLFDLPVSKDSSQNFNLTCEFHINPANHQSHVNLISSNTLDSINKSISNPICNDSYLYDSTKSQILTMKSDQIMNQYPSTTNYTETSFISESNNLFNTIGYSTSPMSTNHELLSSRITDNDIVSSCKLQNQALPYLQTVPHFIYINNPNNQITEMKTFSSTKNIPPIQSINDNKVLNRNSENILENHHHICSPLINSPSSLCECKHENDFHISNILMNSPQNHYHPIHEIHNHSHMQTMKDMYIHENRMKKCNSITPCIMNYDSGENLTKSRINISRYFKWCHRLTMTLICLLIFICLCYRIIDYFNRHEMMKSLFVYNQLYVTKRSMDEDNNKVLLPIPEEEQSVSDWFTITLCNLNPMRGSALFTEENGSIIYDNIIRNRQNEIDFIDKIKLDTNNTSYISKELLKRTGHKLNEMLKFCYTGNEQCTFRNFTSILTIYGQCYRMKLKPTVHEIRFILDSQDYDYIIPHRGLTGFRLWIHPNEQQASDTLDLNHFWEDTRKDSIVDFNSLQQSYVIRPNEIIVSTEFQTLIRVAFDRNVHFKQNSMKSGLCSSSTEFSECEQNFNQKSNTDHTIQLSNHHNHNDWNARIISAIQSTKATIMYSLLALRNPNLFLRNKIDLERGLRVQQRAYIKLTNETAFNELRNLVSSYDDLRNQLSSIKQLLHDIQMGIWRDQREALQMTHTDSICSKMIIGYFETLINITQSFHEELCKLSLIDVFYITNSFDCFNYTSSMYDYHNQLNVTNTYQYLLHNHLGSKQFINRPKSINHSLIIHDSVNSIDKSYYENRKNPSLIELQIIQLFFSNITSNSKLKDILRKYLKLLSAKRIQMVSRSNHNRYSLSLGSHLPSSSSLSNSLSTSSSSSSSSPTSSSSSSSIISTASLSAPLSTSTLITSNSLQFPDRSINHGLLNNEETSQLLCTSQIHIHIDSIYNIKLEKLGESIATCLQRLELFQTSINLIIKWNKEILKTFTIDYEHLQKVDETSLVAFTVQIETMGTGVSMTQLTPINKIFNPFDEIMGICFGTLSLLIPLYLIVDYFFTMKCKSSIDRQGIL
ncbi:Acid sensing ion channel 4 pituitary [Schistosoma japonicum]|nr:Acid sensing ion channel 4 pituitary [Schistosoma japonicum]